MKKIIIIIVTVILFIILFIGALITTLFAQDNNKTDKMVVTLTNLSNLTISSECETYRTVVKQYASANGIAEYEGLIMAIMQAETGGIGTDVMMAGEKKYNAIYPKYRGAIIDPTYSIEVACREIKDLIDIIGIESYQNITNNQILLLFSAYHLDRGYISYCNSKYTEESAKAYIREQSLPGREADKAFQMQKILSLTGNHGNSIDMSLFINPQVKNNYDLVTYCKNAYNSKWGYVMGTYGHVLTPKLFVAKCEQYPDRILQEQQDYIAANYIGIRTADCIGLIKGYMWLNVETGDIEYNKNGFPDTNTEGLYSISSDKGAITAYPDYGSIVYMDGHVGVYIGDGWVIESAGTMRGVIKTRLTIGKRWTHWIKPDSITYY